MNQDDEKKKEAVRNMLAGWLGGWIDIEPTKPKQSSNNGWISVDDFLPKKDGKYLVYYGKLKGAGSKYAIEDFSFYNEGFDSNNILLPTGCHCQSRQYEESDNDVPFFIRMGN